MNVFFFAFFCQSIEIFDGAVFYRVGFDHVDARKHFLTEGGEFGQVFLYNGTALVDDLAQYKNGQR